LIFLSHNYISGSGRISIKGSKEEDHSLVSRKHLSQKNHFWVWRLETGKLGQKSKACPHCYVTQKKKTEDLKKFKKSKLEDFPNPLRV